jgi:hypothetical protein
MTTTPLPIETTVLFLPPQASPGRIEQCLPESHDTVGNRIWMRVADRARIGKLPDGKPVFGLPGRSGTALVPEKFSPNSVRSTGDSEYSVSGKNQDHLTWHGGLANGRKSMTARLGAAGRTCAWDDVLFQKLGGRP